MNSGDSYSETAFSVSGTQPSTANPIGNPAFPGDTSSDGANWVSYLTGTYNQSLLLTYNFATSGATLNTSIIASESLSVQEELTEYFLADYADSDVWDASTSLFTVWVVINDVDLSYTYTNMTNTTYVTLFEHYRALVDTLYEEGARNFMLINVPPIDRAPVTTGFSTAATRVPECHAAIANWNERLQDLQTDLTAAYSDATVFYIDANTLFNDVIDDPTEFAATSTYQDTADYCAEYTKLVLHI